MAVGVNGGSAEPGVWGQVGFYGVDRMFLR